MAPSRGDLRGVVEDALGVARKVRVSVPTFQGVGSLIEGSALVATLPDMVAKSVVRHHPHLRRTPLPFELGSSPMELLYRRALEDDDAIRFVRDQVTRLSKAESRR